MRHLGTIFLVCLIIAALRFAIMGLLVLFGVLLLWGIVTRPREVAGAILLCVAAALVQVHPWICLIVLAGGAIIAAI